MKTILTRHEANDWTSWKLAQKLSILTLHSFWADKTILRIVTSLQNKSSSREATKIADDVLLKPQIEVFDGWVGDDWPVVSCCLIGVWKDLFQYYCVNSRIYHRTDGAFLWLLIAALRDTKRRNCGQRYLKEKGGKRRVPYCPLKETLP